MEEKNEEGQAAIKDRKHLMVIMTISCLMTICFAGLYVRQLGETRRLEESAVSESDTELSAIRKDYAAALLEVARSEEREINREDVIDTAGNFIDAFFIVPDSEEALLDGCSRYVTGDALRMVEILAANREYNDRERFLFFYRIGCSEKEDEEGTYSVFSLFTVREVEDGAAYDSSYILSATVETDGDGSVITQIDTMPRIYFHAD